MTNITDKMVDFSALRSAEYPGIEPILMDDTLFRQMFRFASDGKREPVQMSGEDRPVSTVGNPTVCCQQDGGAGDFDGSDDHCSPAAAGQEQRSENQGSKDNKDSDNSTLMGLVGGFNAQADRRVFGHFESAGLPRKEIIRLAHALHESVVEGRQSVSLGLRVPVLGELRFDVRIAGKVVLIHAFVESEQAAAALALAVSTLRDKLEEHQLILGRLDVTTMDGDEDEQARDENADAGSSRKRRKTKGDLPLPSLGQLEQNPAGATKGRRMSNETSQTKGKG